MAELTAADVTQYTGGRLTAGAETTRLLDAALKTVRRYCGWRVTPTTVETLTLDGPGSRLLSLPTMHLVELQSITEDGVALTVGDLYVSSRGLVRKKSGACWSCRYGALTVTMNHGYEDATDWQSAVLDLVDRMSQMAGTAVGNSGPMVRKKVDDVEYGWALTIGDPANQSLFDMINHTLVDPYRLETVA